MSLTDVSPYRMNWLNRIPSIEVYGYRARSNTDLAQDGKAILARGHYFMPISQLPYDKFTRSLCYMREDQRNVRDANGETGKDICMSLF